MIPEDLHYSDDHEWVRVDGDALVVGITDFAQEQLGDIVYVDLPEVGRSVAAGSVVGELESTKSVSDVFCPVDGEVVRTNDALDGGSELINSDPYGEGWLFAVRPSADDPTGSLKSAEEYEALISA